ncbi:MAG: tetratricopeptide repeat protein [Blastocatellia bacterium]|nr:tetratricopeptide repeat protein [Blastocatellia bacterium]
MNFSKSNFCRSTLQSWNLLLSRRAFEQAVPVLKKATILKPTYTSAYKTLGASYDELRMYKEASQAYEEAIKLDPKDPVIFF